MTCRPGVCSGCGDRSGRRRGRASRRRGRGPRGARPRPWRRTTQLRSSRPMVADPRGGVRPGRGSVRRGGGRRRRLVRRHRQGGRVLVTNPGELMDYINAPVGKARAPRQHPLLPLVAVPTTTGTGSESANRVMDVLALKVKTGMSHLLSARGSRRRPRPQRHPAGRCHRGGRHGHPVPRVESYTARWYTDFDAKTPEQRVPYCGADRIADLWSERALGLLAGAFRSAVREGWDGARGGRADGDGRDLRRSGCATPECTSPTPRPTRSPAGCGTSGRPAIRGRADRAARDGRRPDRAGGVPVHVRRRARPAPARRPAARPGRRGERARRAAAHPRRPDAGHRAAQRPGRGRLRRGRRRRPGVRGVQQQRLLATAPKPVTAEDLAGIIGSSMQHW